MQDEYRFLTLDGERIAAWVESRVSEEHTAYYPQSLLFFVKSGTLHFRVGDYQVTFPAPAYVLVRKNTLGYYRKSWEATQQFAEVFILSLKDNLVEAVIEDFSPTSAVPTSPLNPVHLLSPNEELIAIFSSIPEYYAKRKEVTMEGVHAGMRAVITACMNSDPDLYYLFQDRATPTGSRLKSIIDHHFNLGLTVEELAELSGLSLSTFYRQFKKEFGKSPHQWLMNRRLQEAYELLKNTDQPVSDIGYETGFKDLAHFSRRFKQKFGLPPSQARG
ncbi:MAG: AraC family transcriptional regulator [Bacteroidota bacterium]